MKIEYKLSKWFLESVLWHYRQDEPNYLEERREGPFSCSVGAALIAAFFLFCAYLNQPTYEEMWLAGEHANPASTSNLFNGLAILTPLSIALSLLTSAFLPGAYFAARKAKKYLKATSKKMVVELTDGGIACRFQEKELLYPYDQIKRIMRQYNSFCIVMSSVDPTMELALYTSDAILVIPHKILAEKEVEGFIETIVERNKAACANDDERTPAEIVALDAPEYRKKLAEETRVRRRCVMRHLHVLFTQFLLLFYVFTPSGSDRNTERFQRYEQMMVELRDFHADREIEAGRPWEAYCDDLSDYFGDKTASHYLSDYSDLCQEDAIASEGESQASEK